MAVLQNTRNNFSCFLWTFAEKNRRWIRKDFSPYFPRKVIGKVRKRKNKFLLYFFKEILKICLRFSMIVVGGKSVFDMNIFCYQRTMKRTTRISRMKSKGGFHRIWAIAANRARCYHHAFFPAGDKLPHKDWRKRVGALRVNIANVCFSWHCACVSLWICFKYQNLSKNNYPRNALVITEYINEQVRFEENSRGNVEPLRIHVWLVTCSMSENFFQFSWISFEFSRDKVTYSRRFWLFQKL